MLRRCVLHVTSGLLLIVLVGAAGNAAPPPFPDFGTKDVIFLESGRQITGKIEKRTKTAVYIHDGTKRRGFRRTYVVATSFGDAAARAQVKKQWKGMSDEPDAWYGLGVTCAKKRLGVEGALCFMHVLVLDPEHRKAHIALGHAELDGTWLGRAEVRKKIAEGYVKKDGTLVKKGEGSSGGKTTVQKEEKKKKKKWPEHGRRVLNEKSWTKAELARFERLRENRSKDAAAFKKQTEKEYLGVPWVNHYEIKTRNYIIRCNSTRAVTNRYARLMEQLHRMLSKHFPADRKGLKGRSVVHIYRNGDDFREHTGMFWGVGGFYRPDNGMLCGYHGTFGSTATTFNVLAHEGTHQFQGKVLRKDGFRNTPMWLIEGLAVYFGDGAQIDPSGKLVTERIPRDRLLHIQDKIRADKYERLAKLVTLGRRGFSGSHYADSWALIHFLVNSGSEGQKLLSAYWNVAQRQKIEYAHFEAVAEKHSGSVAAVEEKYLKHVMGLRPDPAGEIRGDYYYSREFAFELRRLGPGWRFYEEYKRGFLVGQELPGTTAEVEVLFWNNDERAQSGQDYVKQFVTTYWKEILPARYSSIKATRVEMHGTAAFRFTYEDGGTGTSVSGVDDLMDALRRRRSGLPGHERREGKPRLYVEFLIVDFDGTFSIRASAEKEEFPTYREIFLKLQENFEPIHERRW